MKKQFGYILSTLLIFASSILFFGCEQNPKPPASLSDFFKSTDWVAEHAGDAKFVIVDTRPVDDYALGHIPGAISIPRTNFYFPRTQIDGLDICL